MSIEPATTIPEVDQIPDTEVRARPVEGSLKSLAVRGSAWTIAGYGASQILRLASNLVLTRILIPDAFGLASLVSVFLQGLQMFSDVGIGPNIIRSPRGDDPAFLNTAWTLQVVRGLMLWLCSILIAYPVAMIYDQPQLAWLIPAAGATAAIQGINSTALFTCVRRLLVSRLILLEIFVQAVSLVVTVTLALMYRSVWALIAGGIVGAILKMVLSHKILVGPGNKFFWDQDAQEELFGFGRWIFLSTIMAFLAMQIDRVLLGKLVTMRDFGLYTIAASLAQIPRDVIQKLTDLVVFPMVTKVIYTEGGAARIKTIRRLLLLISTPLCLILIIGAHALVAILFDSRYSKVGNILSILVVGTWIQTITVSYAVVVMAAGRPGYITGGLILRLGLFLALIWPLFHRFGMMGVAGLTALSELGVMSACIYGAARIKLPRDDPFERLET